MFLAHSIRDFSLWSFGYIDSGTVESKETYGWELDGVS